jgi:DNA polymerase V
MLLELVPAARAQGSLFDPPDTARSKARMCAVDALNRRFGRDTVTFATSGRHRAWQLRRDFISPRFTTNWDELLRV